MFLPRRRRLLFALCLLAPAAWSQPAIEIGTADARPGESGTLAVDFKGTGAGVERLSAELSYPAELFSSLRIFCPVSPPGFALRCRVSAPGRIELQASSPGGEIPDTPLGRIRFTLAETAPPDPQVPVAFVLEREDYRDAGGDPVTSVGSVAGTVFVQEPVVPTAMVRGSTGRGQALVFPYFSARDGRESRFVLRNASAFPKAVRLNLREGYNGQLLLSEPAGGPGPATALNLYLPPGGASLLRVYESAGSTLLDVAGCSFPAPPPGGFGLSGANYSGDPATEQSDDRLKEGFVTAFVLADLDPMVFDRAALAAPGCPRVQSYWSSVGPWSGAPLVDTLPPRGGLEGAWSLRGLRGRVSFDAAAVALRGFVAGDLSAHRGPWEPYTLNQGRSTARRGGPTITFGAAAEAVSALLLTESQALPIRASGTEWILSQPTKWLFTDPARQPQDLLLPPLPFTSLFGAGGACDPITLLPQSEALATALCWNTNIVPFTGSGTAPSLFDSALATAPVSLGATRIARVDLGGLGLPISFTERLPGLPVLGKAIPFRADRDPRQQVVDFGARLRSLPKAGKGDADPLGLGASVSVSGRLVFVGVPGASGGRGAVFVFRRHGTVFVPEATLEAAPDVSVARFGAALDGDGKQVVIGAPGDPGPGAKGAQTMQAALWERIQGVWNEKVPVLSDSGNPQAAGTAVALEGDVFAIGAPGDDVMGTDAGAVLVFNDGDLSTTLRPQAGDQMGQFGTSLDIKQGILATGSPAAEIAGSFGGSVSLYGQIAGNLQNPPVLGVVSGEGTEDGDGFGTALSFDGTMLAVGAPGADGGSGQDPVPDQGQVALFEFDGSNLNAGPVLVDEEAGVGAGFGQSVALYSGGLVTGAPNVLGGAGQSGAVYEYTMEEGQFLPDGRISPDEDGVSGYGSSVASDGELTLVGAPSTAEEAGAALVVVDAEVLFFDDYETELR